MTDETIDEAAEAVPEALHIFPSHRRGNETLVVAIGRSDQPDSDELVITDEGADVPTELAQHLIDTREATLEAPATASE